MKRFEVFQNLIMSKSYQSCHISKRLVGPNVFMGSTPTPLFPNS